MSPRIANRYLLKLSGEALAGGTQEKYSEHFLQELITELRGLVAKKIQIAIVVGGGNIYRGRNEGDDVLPRTERDAQGMEATTTNGVKLQEVFLANALPSQHFDFRGHQGALEYYPRHVREYLHGELGKIAILSGGTGNAYCTTDTAAAFRALDLDCTMILKGTTVDGIYEEDPDKNPNAKRIKQITHKDALLNEIKVMDGCAFGLCMENNMPIKVFSLEKCANISKAIEDPDFGSLVITEKK